MKAAPFDLYRPHTVSDACRLMDEMRGEFRVIAGGQTLMPTLAMRIATPGVLIDISGIQDLRYIRVENDTIVISAMVRQAEAEGMLRSTYSHPALAAVLPWVAHPPIRNRGTVVGSIAHADPSAEIPLVLATLGGGVLAKSRRGQRFIKAEDLFVGALQTSLATDELILEAHFPMLRAQARVGFAEFGYRHGDFAVVSVLIIRDDVGVKLGLGGIDDVPRVFQFSGLVNPTELRERVAELASSLEVREDPATTVAFRRHLISTLSNEAIEQIWT